MKFKWILMLVVALLLLIVLFQNRHVTTLRFLFWTMQLSQVLVVVIAALAGFVLGLLARVPAKRV